MVWYKPWTWSLDQFGLFENKHSVTVPATAIEHDVDRRYAINTNTQTVYAKYEYPLSPPVHGFDSIQINLDTIAQHHDPEDDWPLFLWWLCVADIHETVHKYEDDITTDDAHQTNWKIVIADILDEVDGHKIKITEPDD